MNAWEATAPSPSLRGWNWTVVGPVRVLLSFPSSLQHRKKEQGASVLTGGSDNEQLPYSTWHCRANTPVIFPSGVNQPDFLFSVQNVVNQNHLIQTEWYFGVSTLIFPSSPLLFFFSSHICLPKNIIWTEPKWPQAILAVDRSKYPPRHHHLLSSMSIFTRLGLSCDSPGWFNMMHVVAKLMFFSKEPKNTALSLGHTTNGHFHVAALTKLTNASTPDSPSWHSRKKTSRRTVCVSVLKLAGCFFNPEGETVFGYGQVTN